MIKKFSFQIIIKYLDMWTYNFQHQRGFEGINLQASPGSEISHNTEGQPPWEKIPKSAIKGGTASFMRRKDTESKIVEPIKIFIDQHIQARHIKECLTLDLIKLFFIFFNVIT